ncbi:MAG: flagellar basal body P-ring formation chaperone FlgA [Armatimonadota bacterium]
MKRAILIIQTVYMAFFACVAADAAAARVILRPESEVQPAQSVKIEDIARIEAPQKLAERIGDIVVASSLLPGKHRSVETKYIKVRLKSANLDKKVDLVGPDSVDIVGKCIKISSDDLSSQAKSFVMNSLSAEGMTYDIVVDRAPREITIAQSDNVEVRPRLASGGFRPGVNTIVLDVVSDGRTVATSSAALTIKTVAEVLVATKSMRQGEAITASNTSWERRDITFVQSAIIRNTDQGNQELIAKRTIQPGSTITTESVELPPDVRRGDTVNLVVKCGNVILHTTAQVKQDGRAGDTVRVVSAVSQDEVRAQVVEPGMVEIVR